MMHSGMNFETAAMPLAGDLYRAAFGMVHDESAAERLLHRAYLKASREFGPSWQADEVRRRLFRCLFREIHTGRNAWLQIAEWLTGNSDTPDKHSDRNEILQELDIIPGMVREVVLLADVEGFNKSESAWILGVSEELVASRLAEGRTRLRAALGNPLLAQVSA